MEELFYYKTTMKIPAPFNNENENKIETDKTVKFPINYDSLFLILIILIFSDNWLSCEGRYIKKILNATVR